MPWSAGPACGLWLRLALLGSALSAAGLVRRMHTICPVSGDWITCRWLLAPPRGTNALLKVGWYRCTGPHDLERSVQCSVCVCAACANAGEAEVKMVAAVGKIDSCTCVITMSHQGDGSC
jgi:hypothetical protein